MGIQSKIKQTLSFRTTAQISPLLQFMAGDAAPTLAVLWPAPHGDFLVLPTARRHAAAILVLGASGHHGLGEDSIVRFAERQKDRVVAELIVGPSHCQGFMNMLGKCGEVLWSLADYQNLVALWKTPETNTILRHLSEVRPEALAPMLQLPHPLRTPKIMGQLINERWAQDVALAYDVIGRMKGEAFLSDVPTRWSRPKDRKAFFARIVADMQPDAPVVQRMPPKLPAPFEMVSTRQMLESVALEFKNCLKDFIHPFATNRMAVYVWRGSEKAAIALMWNLDGWRLAEAEGEDNEPLEEAALKEIVAALKLAGVRTGPAWGALMSRLEGYGRVSDSAANYEDASPRNFVDSLDLGDLWQ